MNRSNRPWGKRRLSPPLSLVIYLTFGALGFVLWQSRPSVAVEMVVNSAEIADGDVRFLAWQYVAIVEVGLSEYARNQFADARAMANYLTNQFFDGVGHPAPRTAHHASPRTLPTT